MAQDDRTNRWKNPTAALLACYWLTLFLGTHVPYLPRALHVPSDKTLHFFAYAGLAFLFSLNWSLRRALGWRQRIWIFVWLAAFGAFDEITQIPVGRTCDFMDWIADAAGSVSGLALFLALSAAYGTNDEG